MKISTQIHALSKLVGAEKAIEMLGKAGFDAWDFSLFPMAEMNWETNCLYDISHPLRDGDYLAYARKLRHIGEEYGMVCNQSHAPFPIYNDEIRSLQKRAIECTAEAGGKICVVHPCNTWSVEQNTEFYLELLPFAKEHGVKIATENMWNWVPGEPQSCFAACATSEDFLAHLEAINDPYFVACLDIGHAEMRGSGSGAVNMIRALGKHVQALHVHDNDLIHDNHFLPFSKDIDFEPICAALKEIGYAGEMTLEADNCLLGYTAETAFEGVKKMAEVAKKLAAMCE